MTTPLDAVAGSLAAAKLVVTKPNVPFPDVPLRFNPTEYQIQKQNTFVEIPIPGLESPPLQFVRGGAAKLSVEVLLDTSDTLDDVRERYTQAIEDLMRVDAHTHAPPLVSFVWRDSVFSGVMESAQTTFTLFTPLGVPIRAKMTLVLKEHVPVEVQVQQMRTESPNFDKVYTVRRGDTLASIAAWAYQDPSLWRVIADANGIQDPRRLAPGVVLSLPRLR